MGGEHFGESTYSEESTLGRPHFLGEGTLGRALFLRGERHFFKGRALDATKAVCLPKAELKTKTNPNGHHFLAVWVRFGFQLGSLEKSVPACVENCVVNGKFSIFRLKIWSKIQIYHFQKMLFKYPPPWLRAQKIGRGI